MLPWGGCRCIWPKLGVGGGSMETLSPGRPTPDPPFNISILTPVQLARVENVVFMVSPS